MPNTKTRPTNNFHCFEGMGRPYWQAIARGMRPSGISMGHEGAKVDLIVESDGFAAQNGGMQSPQEAKLPAGTYFRFFGTIAHNRYGGKAAMAGGWWIDFENALQIKDWAMRYDLSLAQAAAQLLVIPPEWHDCGYAGRGILKTTMKAWVGHGKPATGSVSPDSAVRKTAGASLHAAPPARSVKQYFIPGERSLIASVFEFDAPLQVIAKGKYPPGL